MILDRGFLAWVQSIGIELTPVQAMIAAVVADGHQPADFGSAAEIAFGCQTVPDRARSVVALLAGARSGKSFVFGGLLSAYRALTADISSLAAGELATALIVAPDQRLGRQVLSYIKGLNLHVEADKDSCIIVRPDGGRVRAEVLPATRGGSAVRGRNLVSAFLDECCFFRSADTGIVNDLEVYKAVAPRVLPGGQVILSSTAWGKSGLLFERHTKNWSDPRTCIAATARTEDCRTDAPHVLEMVQRERENDPTNARREFDCEWLSNDSRAFFQPESVEAALARPFDSRAALVQTAAGCDLATVSDSASFVLVGRYSDGTIRPLVSEEWRPAKGSPLQLRVLVPLIADLAKTYKAYKVHCDHHILEPAREWLPPGPVKLEPVGGGANAKYVTHTQCRELLPQVALAGHDLLAEQLGSIVAEPLPGGGTRLSAPRKGGRHGDIASAFVLAVAALSGKGRNAARLSEAYRGLADWR